MEILSYLFFPFVFYPIWGIFACFFVAIVISKKVVIKYGVAGATAASTLILLVFFTPVVVLSEGGNIPVIFPLMAVYLGYILNPLLDAPIEHVSSFSVTIIFAPVSVFMSIIVASIVRRKLLKSK
ncbi:MAG: hypothetical protein JRC87_11060 [Deltaproteobacteria bacterium]|nr:hypothetical protein [Deltaproteobacteria bacterium]